MENMEDQTMKLSGLPPFPQSLEIAKERRLPHSHSTTTTDISTLQRYGQLNFAATESRDATPGLLLPQPSLSLNRVNVEGSGVIAVVTPQVRNHLDWSW
jgi:hypothetical protein